MLHASPSEALGLKIQSRGITLNILLCVGLECIPSFWTGEGEGWPYLRPARVLRGGELQQIQSLQLWQWTTLSLLMLQEHQQAPAIIAHH